MPDGGSHRGIFVVWIERSDRLLCPIAATNGLVALEGEPIARVDFKF
jgi:hypothetical protein